MRKFRIIAAAVTLVAGAFALSLSTPATAATACVGQGTITLTPTTPGAQGLWAVGLPAPAQDVSASVSGSIGCLGGVTQGAVNITGSLTGRCGRSVGTVSDGTNTYQLQTAGTMLVLIDLAGGVAVGNAVADPLHGAHGTHTGNSCTNGTAHSFIVTGLAAHA